MEPSHDKSVCYYSEHDPWIATGDAKAAGYKGPGWYFWDETEAYCHGPYEDREKAVNALGEYALTLIRGAKAADEAGLVHSP